MSREQWKDALRNALEELETFEDDEEYTGVLIVLRRNGARLVWMNEEQANHELGRIT